MAIACPACGRDYDVTLFAYGRTIWCTCGSRVAGEHVARRLEPGAGMRFLADAMLGRLARWLRILGFDCAHEADIADALLVRRAVDEQRTLLTRDRALPVEWTIAGVHVLEAERPFDQVVEVLRTFELAEAIRLFQRCSRCNRQLEPIPASEAEGRVPEDVRASQAELRSCPDCGRVYWEGGHTRRMQRTVEHMLAAV